MLIDIWMVKIKHCYNQYCQIKIDLKQKKDCIYYLKTHKYYDGTDTEPHLQYWRCRQYMPDDTNYYYRVLPVSRNVKLVSAYLKDGSASHK